MEFAFSQRRWISLKSDGNDGLLFREAGYRARLHQAIKGGATKIERSGWKDCCAGI